MTQGFSIDRQVDYLFCEENESELNARFRLKVAERRKDYYIALVIEEIQTNKIMTVCVSEEIVIQKQTLVEVKRKKQKA